MTCKKEIGKAFLGFGLLKLNWRIPKWELQNFSLHTFRDNRNRIGTICIVWKCWNALFIYMYLGKKNTCEHSLHRGLHDSQSDLQACVKLRYFSSLLPFPNVIFFEWYQKWSVNLTFWHLTRTHNFFLCCHNNLNYVLS